MPAEEFAEFLTRSEGQHSGDILIRPHDYNGSSAADIPVAEDVTTVAGGEDLVDVNEAQGNLDGHEGLRDVPGFHQCVILLIDHLGVEDRVVVAVSRRKAHSR